MLQYNLCALIFCTATFQLNSSTSVFDTRKESDIQCIISDLSSTWTVYAHVICDKLHCKLKLEDVALLFVLCLYF